MKVVKLQAALILFLGAVGVLTMLNAVQEMMHIASPWKTAIGLVIDGRAARCPGLIWSGRFCIQPLSYQYKVEGETLKTTEFSRFLSLWGISASDLKKLDRTGESVIVYYKPEDPRAATLEVGPLWGRMVTATIGLSLLIGAIWLWKRRVRKVFS